MMTEITDPLIGAWEGSDIALLEALRHIAENTVTIGHTVLVKTVPSNRLTDFSDIENFFFDDCCEHGTVKVAKAFADAADVLEAQLLEESLCPSCGGEITEDGCAGDSSVWCSDCGKDWT